MKPQGWTILTILFAVLCGLAFSLKPWRELQAQRAESNSAIQEAKDIEAQRATLVREDSRLDSPFGMEERARQRGYRKPTERPLTVDTTNASD